MLRHETLRGVLHLSLQVLVACPCFVVAIIAWYRLTQSLSVQRHVSLGEEEIIEAGEVCCDRLRDRAHFCSYQIAPRQSQTHTHTFSVSLSFTRTHTCSEKEPLAPPSYMLLIRRPVPKPARALSLPRMPARIRLLMMCGTDDDL